MRCAYLYIFSIFSILIIVLSFLFQRAYKILNAYLKSAKDFAVRFYNYGVFWERLDLVCNILQNTTCFGIRFFLEKYSQVFIIMGEFSIPANIFFIRAFQEPLNVSKIKLKIFLFVALDKICRIIWNNKYLGNKFLILLQNISLLFFSMDETFFGNFHFVSILKHFTEVVNINILIYIY